MPVAKKTVVDLRTRLQNAKPPQRSVRICLRGDLIGRIEDLDEQIYNLDQERKAVGDDRLSGNATAVKLAAELKKVREEAEAESVVFTFHALPKGQYADLKAKSPGKDGKEVDHSALFAKVIPLSIIEPEVDSETLDKFLDGLTEGQYDSIVSAVHFLNEGGGDLPFSRNASRALHKSDET